MTNLIEVYTKGTLVRIIVPSQYYLAKGTIHEVIEFTPPEPPMYTVKIGDDLATFWHDELV